MIRSKQIQKFWNEIGDGWRLMTFYEKFEQVVAVILTTLMAIVIVEALIRLAMHVFAMFLTGAFDPLAPNVFQKTFGMVMTLLIAMEFKHSILKVAARKESIIQVKTVVLIAILAITRKFIILDVGQYSAALLAALAASVVALGVVYWLMRERDDHAIS